MDTFKTSQNKIEALTNCSKSREKHADGQVIKYRNKFLETHEDRSSYCISTRI